MKNLTYIFTTFILFSFLLTMSCSDDDTDLTLEQQQIQAIVGDWSVSSTNDVRLDNGDAPGDWSNFSITFTQGGSVNVGGVPSEAAIFNLSSYSVSGENTSLILLTFNENSSETATAQVNNNEMTLTFTLTSDEDQLGARQKSVNGTWTFFLTVQ